MSAHSKPSSVLYSLSSIEGGFPGATARVRGNRTRAKRGPSCSTGFTLVELLVAMGLFAVVMGIAVGGFVSAIRTQRQAAGLLLANSNASLVLEQMAREIRTGYQFSCAPLPECQTSVLSFTNMRMQLVTYSLSGGAIFRNGAQLTAANVDVQYLNFYLSGTAPNDGYPPRITITLGVSSREAGVSANPVRIQTTVSARPLDDFGVAT